MKILPQKELAMKRAIIKTIENGHSSAKLADHFGVSKSTIYKYRRILREQGFITKDENDNFIITDIKFSKQEPITQPEESASEQINNKENDLIEIRYADTNQDMEQRLQSKIEKMHATFENAEKGLIQKFFSRFKKK